MKALLLRLVLLRGPVWHRLFIAAFYIVVIAELSFSWALFSLPAYEVPQEQDRYFGMGLWGERLIAFLTESVAFAVWVIAALTYIVSALRRRAAEQWGLWWAATTPLCYYAAHCLYAAAYDGRAHDLHRFLYTLPYTLRF